MNLPPEQRLPVFEALRKLEYNPNNSEQLIQALMELGKWTAAEAELTTLIDRPPYPQAIPGYRRLRAICRISSEDDSKASPDPKGILADLRVAVSDPFELEQVRDSALVTTWLTRNQIERSAIGL